MNCPICRKGETHPGTVTVTLERESLTFVVKHVPAAVCDNCGEEYLDESTVSQVLRMAEEAVASGVEVDIRAYRAA
jgi:YgiT-type zinc finger domain-containing protein